MIQSITLRRRARFVVLSCRGSRDNQCGSRGTSEFEYEVRITTDPVISPEGFIIDSLEVKRYFEERFGNVDVLPSCEVMAMRACEDLSALVGETCQRIEVEVGTDALAGLSAVWERPPRKSSRTNDFPPSGETLS